MASCRRFPEQRDPAGSQERLASALAWLRRSPGRRCAVAHRELPARQGANPLGGCTSRSTIASSRTCRRDSICYLPMSKLRIGERQRDDALGAHRVASKSLGSTSPRPPGVSRHTENPIVRLTSGSRPPTRGVPLWHIRAPSARRSLFAEVESKKIHQPKASGYFGFVKVVTVGNVVRKGVKALKLGQTGSRSPRVEASARARRYPDRATVALSRPSCSAMARKLFPFSRRRRI